MSRKLFTLLKALLVIGFVYWIVLVTLIVYLLFTQSLSDSEHLCVWLGCTFILIIVFGAVLSLGVLVVYYLGLGEQSGHSQTDYNYTTSEHWLATPITVFHQDFQRLVNLDMLVPHLCTKQILHGGDLDSLNGHYHQSRAARISRLIAILDKKGKEGMVKLIESLKEEDQHSGHSELAWILDDHYRLQLAGYPKHARNQIERGATIY